MSCADGSGKAYAVSRRSKLRHEGSILPHARNHPTILFVLRYRKATITTAQGLPG